MLVDFVELVSVREGTYTIYVFRKIDTKEFIMCTKLPNWNTPSVFIGDKGFLKYNLVKAGETYFNPSLDKDCKYLYSNVYFMDFVIDNKIIHKNEIIL